MGCGAVVVASQADRVGLNLGVGAAMSGPLTYTAACPACGTDARWMVEVETYHAPGRVSEVACPACDGAEAVEEPEPPAVIEQLPKLPQSVRDLALWRMIQNALDRRAA